MENYNVILEELKKYKGKEILCIKDYNTKIVFFKQDKFYLLDNVRYNTEGYYNSSNTKIEAKVIGIEIILLSNRIVDGNDFAIDFTYEQFVEFFEPITLPELRQRKIQSILD